MRKVEVEITGLSPLLMHRFGEEAQAQVSAGTSHVTDRPAAAEAAERSAYRMASPNGAPGNLYIPGTNLLESIRRASGFHKIGKRSARMFFAGSVFVTPEQLDLGTTQYSLDSRPVVIKATKGRVMRHRARLDSWKVRFTLEYDEKIITSAELPRNVLDDAGAKIGVLDYRPERGGSFGRFAVTRWKPRFSKGSRRGAAGLGWAGPGVAGQGKARSSSS